MGRALAAASLAAGHRVTVVSGPVEIRYPEQARVVDVISTEDMLAECRKIFPQCDGLIGVAAPCDYRPVRVAEGKIKKNGQPLLLELVETADVVATLGAEKRPHQWIVGFALETEDQHFRAITKLEKKSCDLMLLNGPQAMHSDETRVEVLDSSGQVIGVLEGSKDRVAEHILRAIQKELM